LLVPGIRTLLGIVPLNVYGILMVAGIAIALLGTVELAKWLRKLIYKKKNYGY
jgi:prolipoprotein diacylglyceryltransferase